jgi:hypothetical protein
MYVRHGPSVFEGVGPTIKRFILNREVSSQIPAMLTDDFIIVFFLSLSKADVGIIP